MLVFARVFLIAAIAAAMAGASAAGAGSRATFLFFWAERCPHCADAQPFVRRLEKEHPELRFEWWEVSKDPNGRRRFAGEVKRLGIRNPVVPTFVCGDRYLTGFAKGTSEPLLRDLARRCPQSRDATAPPDRSRLPNTSELGISPK